MKREEIRRLEEEKIKQLEERKRIEEEERQRLEEEMKRRIEERVKELEEKRIEEERLRIEAERKRLEEERLRREQEEEARQQSALELIEEEEPISPTNPNRLSVFSRELVSLCGEVRKINNSLKKEELQNTELLPELDEEEDSDLVSVIIIFHYIVIIY